MDMSEGEKMIQNAPAYNLKFQSAEEDRLKILYRLVCIAKGFSEIDALEDYVRDLLNVPDVRLASEDRVLSAIKFLRGPSEYMKYQPVSFEVLE